MEAAKIAMACLHASQSAASPLRRIGINLNCNHSLASRFLRQSAQSSTLGSKLLRSRSSGIPKSRFRIINRACSASLDGFSDDDDGPTEDELIVRVEKLQERMKFSDGEDEIFPNFSDEEAENSDCDDDSLGCGGYRNSRPFGKAEPPWPAIAPKGADWYPGGGGKIPPSKRGNEPDLPTSWNKGTFAGAGESAYCSVKKAFASMVFIIREMQSYALQLREILFYEALEEILVRAQKEMHASFVWLFQKIFSGTPTLMVYVMILLANFTVYSMRQNANMAVAALPQLAAVESISVVENQQRPKFHPLSILLDDDETSTVKRWEMSSSHEESIDEGSRMQRELRHESLDHETMREFVLFLIAKMELGVTSSCFFTELIYQRAVLEEPNNPLWLANYGEYLQLVHHDLDRAEEYLARAARADPPDAEALSLYARFMWNVRNDLWTAEENFLRAAEEELSNPHHTGTYARFLLGTGCTDTCYPLS